MSDASIHLQSMKNRPELAVSSFGGKQIFAPEIAGPRWQESSMEEMIDHLVTHDHAHARDVLRELKRLLTMSKEIYARPPAYLAEIEERVEVLRRGLEENMAAEEKVVFDLIRSLEREEKLTVFHCANIANPINSVREAQESIKAQMRDLLVVSEEHAIEYGECGISVAIHQNLRALAADLDDHFHAESDVLFPRAIDRESELAARG